MKWARCAADRPSLCPFVRYHCTKTSKEPGQFGSNLVRGIRAKTPCLVVLSESVPSKEAEGTIDSQIRHFLQKSCQNLHGQ